jgi:hypothetical protein
VTIINEMTTYDADVIVVGAGLAGAPILDSTDGH